MSHISRRDFLKFTGASLAGTLLAVDKVSAAAVDNNPDDHIGMLYDATKCVGCNACTLACRRWNETIPEVLSGLYDAPRELSGDTWTLIQLYKGDSDDNYSFIKRQCMHCVDPACVSGCPVKALQKSPEGPVTYDPDRCIGCRYCMYTCPFDVPRFEWDERIPVVTKCTLCKDRLDQDLGGPFCAENCPTGALIWGRRADLVAEAERRVTESPDRYEEHIYGKEDAGGTSVIYLAGVTFEKLGLPDLGTEPIPALSERAANLFIPSIIIGGPLLLASIRAVAEREGWD